MEKLLGERIGKQFIVLVFVIMVFRKLQDPPWVLCAFHLKQIVYMSLYAKGLTPFPFTRSGNKTRYKLVIKLFYLLLIDIFKRNGFTQRRLYNEM